MRIDEFLWFNKKQDNAPVEKPHNFLTFQNMPSELLNRLKTRRQFFSIKFVKNDGSIRVVRNATCSLNSILKPNSTDNRGKWNRVAKNILVFKDMGKINPETGKGSPIQCHLSSIIAIKVGNQTWDFTEQNEIKDRFPQLANESIITRALREVLFE
jgi:hypothetical protein